MFKCSDTMEVSSLVSLAPLMECHDVKKGTEPLTSLQLHKDICHVVYRLSPEFTLILFLPVFTICTQNIRGKNVTYLLYTLILSMQKQ